MITTGHTLSGDNLNIYIETKENGKMQVCFQARSDIFKASESDGFMYLRGEISVADLEEISTLFDIAFECNI